MPRSYKSIKAREAVLVDAQSLLQRALNETFGDPRDFEETSPNKARIATVVQRCNLAKRLDLRSEDIHKLFKDDANPKVKDLAECFAALGYELKLDIVKSKD